MRAPQRLILLLPIFICRIALIPPALTKAPEGEKFVEEKGRFSLQIPPGWRESKKLMKLKKLGVLAAFQNAEQKLAVAIRRSPFSATPLGESPFILSRDFRGMSNYGEAMTVLSGLPAGMVMFSSGNQARRFWVLVVSVGLEDWAFEVSGPHEVLCAPDSSHFQEAQQMIESFQFSKPVLARLKAGRRSAASTLPPRKSADFRRLMELKCPTK